MNQTVNNKKSILYYNVYLMFLVSSFLVFQFAGYTFLLWFEMLFCLLSVCACRKLRFTREYTVNLIFISLFISAVSALTTDMPFSYKKTAVVLPIMIIPVYFTIVYLKNLIKSDIRWINVIKKGIRASVAAQLIWLPIQFVLYKGFHIDINDLIFVKTLHMVDNASFIRSWVWHPSGFSWHSASLAPIFVMGILLFKSMAVRLLIIGEAMICGNSTTFIGVVLCAGLLVINSLLRQVDYKKIKLVNLAALLLVMAAAGVAILKFDLLSEVAAYALKLWNRLFGSERDASTEAHLGYYSDYIKIVKNSSLIQTLFGYGYGCSGYTITVMYGRYTALSSWAIESDYINILVSRGVFGFVVYYYFLLKIMIKGFKLDVRYAIFMAVIFVQGFGYNIQFEYLFLMELVLYFSIKYKINFFDDNKKRKKHESISNCTDVQCKS